MASKLAGWWMVCGSFNFHQTEERSCLFGRTNGVIWRETDRPQQPGGGPNLCVNRVQLWEVTLVFGSWMRRWLRAPSRLVRIPLNRNNPASCKRHLSSFRPLLAKEDLLFCLPAAHWRRWTLTSSRRICCFLQLLVTSAHRLHWNLFNKFKQTSQRLRWMS